MKKLITVLIFISLTIVGFGQLLAPKGIKVGTGANLLTITNLTSTVDGSTIFVKQLQDTVSFTADTKTLALTDAGKIIYCSNVNFQKITIPTNSTVAFPVGTIITFINTGPGIIKLTPAATVIRKSVLDSCTMNTVNQTYQIIKRATNKWYFIGDWRD